MKLKKVLTVAGQTYPLAYDETYLSLSNPGRATFTIEHDEPITGLVSLDIGYNNELKRFFSGYIENCTQSNSNQFKLFAREFSSVLKEPLLINLRHCTLKDLIKEIATKTGLRFRLPSADYINNKAPFFYNIGTGYNALDSIQQVFNIDDYLWHQEDDGAIFLGSWADSYWGKVASIDIPLKFLKDYQATGMATVGCIPVLRPGATINAGNRLQSIILMGEEMVLKWKK